MAVRLQEVKMLLSRETDSSRVQLFIKTAWSFSPSPRLGASPEDSKDYIIKACDPMQDMETAW